MSALQITDATPDDADAIAAVHVRSWQAAYASILDPAYLAALSVADRARRWRDIVAGRQSSLLVARVDERVTAFVSFGRCRDEGAPASQGEVFAIYAAPEAWGQGAGPALLARARESLAAAGFDAVSLWVLSDNARARRFYERNGFVCVPDSAKRFELGGRSVEEVVYRSS